MEQREKFFFKLFNSKIIANYLVSVVIDWIVDFINIIKSSLDLYPCITGHTRLVYRIRYFLLKNDCVKLTSSGIYKNDKLLENPFSSILEFLPHEGIYFSNTDSIYQISEKIKSSVVRKNPFVSGEYYKTKGLYLLIFAGFIASFLCMVYILVSPYYRVPMTKKILSSLWLIPNIYFFLQTVLFYTMRLKHISMKAAFEEASPHEEENLKQSREQPYVITVVPTYLEDPDLVERTVMSLCLQNYKNMEVVLLSGNDVYSKEPEVIENTKRIKKMAIRVKRELFVQKRNVVKKLKKIEMLEAEDLETILKKLEIIGKAYAQISEWYKEKAEKFRNSEYKYPTDDYLIRHTFVKQYRSFRRNSLVCRKLYNEVARKLEANPVDSYGFETLAADTGNLIDSYMNELSGLFNIKLKVFTRTRYINLEQEKTKAGNLTAFTSLIGGTWSRKKLEDGKLMIFPSQYGMKIDEPKYLVSFDSDTIAKPDYILRKVVFMERKSNLNVGLIQSPYVTPTPEPEVVASAAGAQSYWFLPVSVGLTAFNSAFWLGFNGVIRFEAIKKNKSFMTDTIIEDTENSIKIKNEGYQVVTSPEEQCITFSPFDLKALKIQRIRWAAGGFKLAKKLIAGFIKKETGFKTSTEKILGLNYVLGLNTLPAAITAIYFIESPFKYNYFYIEMMPFFLYILSFIVLLKSLTKYKYMNILDGLAVTVFMNLYHIVGTINSLRALFSKERKKFFNSTPRDSEKRFIGIGHLEFYGILIIITWLGMRVVNQLYRFYLDVFPLLHVALALYGILRFRNKKKKLKAVGNMVKSYKISQNKTLAKKRLFNVSKVIRFSAILLAIAVILSGPAISSVDIWVESNNISYDALNQLYHDNTGEYPVDAFKQCERLGKGINLAAAFESEKEGEWGLKLKDEHFKIIKDGGFDTIRVPINWSSRTQRRSPYKIDELFFSRMDWLLLKARENSLNVVLDFHGYNEVYFDPQKHRERFIEIWRQIAGRYKNCDLSVYYEILNEPCEKLTAEVWNQLLKETIHEIRKIDKYHTIIVSGADWGCATGLSDLIVPEDERNVICTFHTYTPMPFTHQGVDYVPQVEFEWIRGISWPGPPEEPVKIDRRLKNFKWAEQWINDYNTITNETNPTNPGYLVEELNFAYNWGINNNRPIWLGEFGVTVNADQKSRERWTDFLTDEAEKRGISWAYWDFGVTCRVYDLKDKEWNEGLLRALIE